MAAHAVPGIEAEELTTRQRVLEAACETFAASGFRDATVSAICRRAEVNIASVNYYFGSKEALYDEVLHHAWRMAEDAFPMPADDGRPERRLAEHIRALLCRGLTPGPASWFARLMVKEMAEPTAALARIEQEVLSKHRDRLGRVVRGIIGERADVETLHRCCFSIISQCLFLNFNRAVREQQLKIRGVGPAWIEDLAEHITRFTLAGLKAIRREVERA